MFRWCRTYESGVQFRTISDGLSEGKRNIKFGQGCCKDYAGFLASEWNTDGLIRVLFQKRILFVSLRSVSVQSSYNSAKFYQSKYWLLSETFQFYTINPQRFTCTINHIEIFMDIGFIGYNLLTDLHTFIACCSRRVISKTMYQGGDRKNLEEGKRAHLTCVCSSGYAASSKERPVIIKSYVGFIGDQNGLDVCEQVV